MNYRVLDDNVYRDMTAEEIADLKNSVVELTNANNIESKVGQIIDVMANSTTIKSLNSGAKELQE